MNGRPSISNGTIMVMERFYETPLDNIPTSYDPVTARMYQLLHAPDYALTRYSIGHFADFIRGMLSIISIREKTTCPALLSTSLTGRKIAWPVHTSSYCGKKIRR